MGEIIQKQCRRCGQLKSPEEFQRQRNAPDLLRYECKACSRKREQRRYAKNKNKMIAKSLEWKKNNPDKMKEIWRRANAKRRRRLKGR